MQLLKDASPPTHAQRAALVAALLYPPVFTWVYFVLLAHSAGPMQQTVYAIGKSLQFVLPIPWLWSALCRREADWRPRWPGAVEGLLFGAGAFAAAWAVYALWLAPAGYFASAAEPIRLKVAGFGVDNLPKFAALGVFYSLVHSWLEEYYWRWFVFGRLRRWVSVPAAIAISSLGFMAHHVIVLGYYLGWASIGTYAFSAAVAVGGAYWAWLYQRSQSLYGPWLSHVVIDAAIFTIGYDLIRGLA